MKKEEKKLVVSSISNSLASSNSLVLGHYHGITVAEMSEMRRAMRKAGVSVRVAKNTLIRLALKGSRFEVVSPLLKGPTILACSEDLIAAAKVMSEFSKKNDKLIILGGSLEGQFLDAKGISALAELPSLDELRGKLLGIINAPATRVATILQAPASQLARVLQAYADKN
jgi:large subunit ribosomal protein L10